MVTKDDVMEMHSQIVAIKDSQARLRKLANSFLDEADRMDGLIKTLEKDYQDLKEKADNQ